MSNKYRVKFPFVPDMGSVSDMIVREYWARSKQEDALWHLNSMRDHDNLPHLNKLPAGTKFTPIED